MVWAQPGPNTASSSNPNRPEKGLPDPALEDAYQHILLCNHFLVSQLKKMWIITSNNLMAGSPHCNWRNASPEIVCAIISRLFWRLIWCLRKNIRTNLTYGVHTTTKDHFNISITLFHQLTMMTFDMKFMRKYIPSIYILLLLYTM